MTDAAPGDATIQFSMLEAMAESLDVAVLAYDRNDELLFASRNVPFCTLMAIRSASIWSAFTAISGKALARLAMQPSRDAPSLDFACAVIVSEK